MLEIYHPERIDREERQEFQNQAKRMAEALRRRYAEVELEAEARGLRLEPRTVYQAAPFQFGQLRLEVFLYPACGQVYFHFEENGQIVALALDEPEARQEAS